MTVDVQRLNNSEELIINDVNGRPVYRLSVYPVSLDNQVVSSIRVELNVLNVSSHRSDTKYEEDLLNPDRWGHGEGRRVFQPAQVCAANRADPSWGARRVFTLRRMRVEVSLADVELSEDLKGFKSASVDVQVKPSPSLRSRPVDIAYREPKPCLSLPH
jgi:hypothetical protein